nr:ribonuclease H-like domain-containing protein [Tanacetum cinerariifolium]
MAHINFKTINKLAKEGLVDGLPLKVFTNEHNCVACNKGKQHKASYKPISTVRLVTASPQLLHMDLFGPTNIRSIDQKYYSLVVTDDFTRFSWIFFLGSKDQTFYVLKEFIALIENQLNKKVKAIRCDNGTEFKNANLIELCGEKELRETIRAWPRGMGARSHGETGIGGKMALAVSVPLMPIHVKIVRPIKLERLATWDGGKTTWGGRVEAMGTVPVCMCVHRKAEVKESSRKGQNRIKNQTKTGSVAKPGNARSSYSR